MKNYTIRTSARIIVHYGKYAIVSMAITFAVAGVCIGSHKKSQLVGNETFVDSVRGIRWSAFNERGGQYLEARRIPPPEMFANGPTLKLFNNIGPREGVLPSWAFKDFVRMENNYGGSMWQWSEECAGFPFPWLTTVHWKFLDGRNKSGYPLVVNGKNVLMPMSIRVLSMIASIVTVLCAIISCEQLVKLCKKELRRQRNACPSCGYELAKNVARCPECGWLGRPS